MTYVDDQDTMPNVPISNFYTTIASYKYIRPPPLPLPKTPNALLHSSSKTKRNPNHHQKYQIPAYAAPNSFTLPSVIKIPSLTMKYAYLTTALSSNHGMTLSKNSFC